MGKFHIAKALRCFCGAEFTHSLEEDSNLYALRFASRTLHAGEANSTYVQPISFRGATLSSRCSIELFDGREAFLRGLYYGQYRFHWLNLYEISWTKFPNLFSSQHFQQCYPASRHLLASISFEHVKANRRADSESFSMATPSGGGTSKTAMVLSTSKCLSACCSVAWVKTWLSWLHSCTTCGVKGLLLNALKRVQPHFWVSQSFRLRTAEVPIQALQWQSVPSCKRIIKTKRKP